MDFPKTFCYNSYLSAPPSESIKNADDFVKYFSEYTSKIRIILLKTEELQNFRTQKTKEWEKVRSINGIRDSHIWQVIRETDDAEIINVERRMRKKKHPRMAHSSMLINMYDRLSYIITNYYTEFKRVTYQINKCTFLTSIYIRR